MTGKVEVEAVAQVVARYERTGMAADSKAVGRPSFKNRLSTGS